MKPTSPTLLILLTLGLGMLQGQPKFGTTTDLVATTNHLLIQLPFERVTATNGTGRLVFMETNQLENLVWLPTNYTPYWSSIIERAQQSGNTEFLSNLVQTICASGEVCKVKGHLWASHALPSMASTYAIYPYPVAILTCEICGKSETQYNTPKK